MARHAPELVAGMDRNTQTLLMANSPASTIANYLTDIRTEHMELPPNREKDEAAVQLLLRWKAKLEGKKPRILG